MMRISFFLVAGACECCAPTGAARVSYRPVWQFVWDWFLVPEGTFYRQTT